jgi:hypothetical protein
MSGDQAGGILYIALLMVLVGSALAARRLPLASSLKMVLALGRDLRPRHPAFLSLGEPMTRTAPALEMVGP